MRLVAAALALALLPALAHATPQHSARAASQCNTCHIEPIGWKNPDLARDRKCALDCQVCHVSSTGGGARKPSGRYFGKEALATFGPRPSAHGNPEKYRSAGDPSTKGEFRLWKGFAGWQAGSTPIEEIADRFGNIEPAPDLRIGGDLRFMSYNPLGDNPDDAATFPMQSDLYLTWAPAKRATAYATFGAMANRNREAGKIRFSDFFRDTPKHADSETYRTLVAIREIFVQADDLPYQGYVRAGRFNRPHGWRVPDHTTFVRRDLGFDQNTQAFGVEAGIAPNYPYANVALFWQGWEKWPGDSAVYGAPKGAGAALTAGYRGLAGQAGLSMQAIRFENGGNDFIVGPIWAVNAFPFVYLGELDFRSLKASGDVGAASQLAAYHELDVYLVQGVNLVFKYDWLDANLDIKDDHKHRYSAGIQLDPINHVQLLLQHRWHVPESPGAKTQRDAIVMLHLWL